MAIRRLFIGLAVAVRKLRQRTERAGRVGQAQQIWHFIQREEVNNMKRIAVCVALAVILTVGSGLALAADQGTPTEAQAMVKKAAAFLKANGAEKAFAEFGNSKGQFVDRDLYIFVYDMKGRCVAHGNDKSLIGKDLIEMKDQDGFYLIKEFVKVAQTTGSGWVDYKWPHPTDKSKIVQKSAYVERCGDFIVGSGVYKY